MDFFLNPFFLAGLGAVALPVMAHLFFRPKAKQVLFPMVRFLLNSHEEEANRRRLRDLLLLLLRILIVALLALMFAQPFLPGRDDSTPRHWIVVWDDTVSMEFTAAGQSCMDEARTHIEGLIRDLRPVDRLSLLSVTGDGDDGFFLERDEAAARWKRARSAQTRPRVDRMTEQVARLTQTPLGAKKRCLLVVSDFQRETWDVLMGIDQTVPVAVDELDVARVGPDEKPNAGLLSAECSVLGADTFAVQCEVANFSDRPLTGLVTATCDNRPLAEVSVSVPAHTRQTADLHFGWPAWAQDALPLTLTLDVEDGLMRDNRFCTVLTRPAGGISRILVVEDVPGQAYLARKALEALQAKHMNWPFTVDVCDYRTFSEAGTPDPGIPADSYGLAVFGGIRSFDQNGIRRFEELLGRGGTALVFLGPELEAASYKALFDRGLIPYLPGVLSRQDRRLVQFSRQSELTKALDAYDLSRYVSYAAYALKPAETTGALLELDDGVPLAGILDTGSGSCMMLNTSADAELSNLTKLPFLLPLLDALFSRGLPVTLAHGYVGDPLRLNVGAAQASGPNTLVSPSGREIRLEPMPGNEGVVMVNADEAGFYHTQGETRHFLAVNTLREECNLDSLSAREVKSLLANRFSKADADEDAEQDAATPAQASVRFSFWQPLGLLILVIMIAELTLANWIRR